MPIAPAAPAPGPSLTAVNMPAPPSAPSTPSTPAPSTPTAPATDHGPVPAPNKELDNMFDKYGQDPADAAKPGPKKVAPKPEAKPEEKPEDVLTEKAKVEPENPATEKTAEKPAEAKTSDKKEKVNPWKRGDEFKELYEKSEAENLRLAKLLPNAKELMAKEEHYKKLEAKNKELLDDLWLQDRRKHPKFQKEFVKPYDDKWNEVWAEIAGAPIVSDGVEKKVEPSDIMDLGKLPAHRLVKEAKAMFGDDLGPYVAERVRELKGLSKAQYDELERAKAERIEFEQKAQESASIEEKQRNDFLASTYEKSLQDLDTHSVYGAYFKAKEGDDEWNAKIDKGNAFVKKAWEQSPLEKGISAEEQANRVKRQAKLQRFAASFSVQQLEISRLKTERDGLLQKLAQYQSSTPDTDGGQIEANGTPQAGHTLDEMFDKYARSPV